MNDNLNFQPPRQIVLASSFAGLLFLAGFFLLRYVSPEKNPDSREPQSMTQEKMPNPFDALHLEAKAVYVWDSVEQRVLFARDEERQLPLASLAKIMTVLVAFERVPEATIVTVDKKFLKQEGNSGLRPGERWRLRDMIDFTLVVSSNDGAGALASVGASFADSPKERAGRTNSFIGAMNEKALRLGLRQTYFMNETGLDRSPVVGGAYGSARDVAHLFSYALEAMPERFEATRYKTISLSSLDHIAHRVENTNPFVDEIPGLIASKTGSTGLAGGNVVIAFDAGPAHPVIIALLGSSPEGRFSDMEKLVGATLKYLQNE